MTTRKKVLIGVFAIAAFGSTAGYMRFMQNRGVLEVQAGRAFQQDLIQTVTANGEIKPKKSVNISSNMMGRIVTMPVKEGDPVREGDLLIRLESIQTEADVRAAEANLEAAQSELEGMDASIRSADATINSARAEVARSQADLNRAQQNFTRAEQLNRDGLISKEQYDRTKAELDIAVAQMNANRARVAQSEAQAAQVLKQKEGVGLRITQQRSSLVRARDQFSKTTIVSPLEGVITYLPVNVGEIAIVGVQNQPGTVLMTIADMSVITAEVKVDETDIVNVKVGQEAEIRVDALGDRVLIGHVSEVGNTALTRSGTSATNTQTTTDEARDFKVIITLDSPPIELKPGLSCTATIRTAERTSVLTIPIQALTVREFEGPAGPTGRKIEKEGVYVINNGIALFREVKTGIVGTTDIEVTDGLMENEEIVTGSFQILRTLKDNDRVRTESPEQ